MITPTAISTTFPRMENYLNSFHIILSENYSYNASTPIACNQSGVGNINLRSARLNNPIVNFDSLVTQIEATRGQKLDKVTRTNLRIRNNWPDMIQLQLTAAWEKSGSKNKYYNAELVIDNSTGYNLDDIEVHLTEWKNQEAVNTDTLHFRNVGYASPARRKGDGIFQGDSLSVSFHSIKSKAFNFCYSADKKSNYGNLGDRWYCKE